MKSNIYIVKSNSHTALNLRNKNLVFTNISKWLFKNRIKNIRIKMALAQQARSKSVTVFLWNIFILKLLHPLQKCKKTTTNLEIKLILYVYTQTLSKLPHTYTNWQVRTHVRVNLKELSIKKSNITYTLTRTQSQWALWRSKRRQNNRTSSHHYSNMDWRQAVRAHECRLLRRLPFEF